VTRIALGLLRNNTKIMQFDRPFGDSWDQR